MTYTTLGNSTTATEHQGEDKTICAFAGPDCLASRDYLATHMLDSHAEKPRGRLECSYCPYTSNTRSHMAQHQQTHTDERPFSCPSCNQKFRQKNHLVKHQRIHTEDKIVRAAPGPAVFVCPECGDCLSSQGYLDKHIQDSHAQRPQGRLECSYCPYTSNWRSHVTKHERTHTGERPFICQLCQKGFTGKGHLRRHQQTVHAKERPHTCATCGMRFAELGNMKKHKMVVHDRQYPHRCPHCSKGLCSVPDLRQHLRARHRGEGEGADGEGEE